MLDKTWAYLQARELTSREQAAVMAALAEVQSLRSLPQIICLCGSTRFMDEFVKANASFTLAGYIVLSVGVYYHNTRDVTEEQKDMLDALHFRKIDLAERVHILNTFGYIGESTYKEIKYAVRQSKLISFKEEKIVPLDTKRKQPVSTAHFMAALREQLGAGEG